VPKIEQYAELSNGNLIGDARGDPMKMRISVLAAVLTALLLLSAKVNAQAPQKASTFTVAGHAGEAQLLQVNGKSYVEVETLARLTKGTLSFKANRTILTLPALDSEATASTPQPQASAPQVQAGFSRPFVQAGIEEMGLIREWRIAIVTAVRNNVPVSEEWASAQHRQAEKNLALASAAVSTDDDRNAFPLLSSEFNNMQKLSALYLALRTRSTAMSPDNFDNGPLEEQILSCARGFVSMTETHEFQDQPACH
jgi:hypothetical protein